MKKILVLCLGLFTVQGLSAQSSTPAFNAGTTKVDLSLDQAIEIALNENPTILIADLEVDRQIYVRRETIGNHLPTLDATGTYTRAVVKSEIASGISFDPDNTIVAGANLTVPLVVPGVYKTLKLNDDQMRAAIENARGSRINLVNEVKKAYFNILLIEESLAVLYSSKENLSQTVEETSLKYNNGLSSEYDLITAQVQLSNIRPNIIQTENSLITAKKLLRMYLSLPESVEIMVQGTLDQYTEMVDEMDYIYDKDLSGNSDLRDMDIQIDILVDQLKLSRTQRYPTLAAFGNLNVTGRDQISFAGITGDGAGGSSFNWTNPFSVGLQLNVPIFAGLTNVNKEKQIKNNINQLRIQRDYLEDNVSLQLTNAVNSLIAAREMMIANLHTVSQAQKGYDISKTRYDAGMGTILEVNTAEVSLTQARLNYTQSVYDYLSAQADHEKIKGEIYEYKN